MEQEKCKEGRQATIQYGCEKICAHTEEHIVASTQRKNNDEMKHHDGSLASPTPEKRIQPPRSRQSKEHRYHFKQEEDASETTSSTDDDHALTIETSQTGGCRDTSEVKNSHLRSPFPSELLKENTRQLSEKYKILAELFDQMIVSVRLLRLRKRLASFYNVSTQVEILTKKKFLLGNLAQMKYLIPEAISAEKILVHDESSLCMKPDLKISLTVDAVKSLWSLQQASNANLCQFFRARLLDFINSHPEDADIPEAPLPDTSSHKNFEKSPRQLPVASPVDQIQLVSADENPSPLGVASHFSPSFSRYLSQKVLDPDERMAEPCSSSVSRISDIAVRESNEDPETHLKDGSRSFSHKACPTEDISSPMKLISEKCETSVNVSQLDDKTPVKPISMPVKLMTETPVLSTPKRPVGTPDVKLTSQTVTPGLSARRALLYSPSKSDEEGSSLQAGGSRETRRCRAADVRLKIAACTGEHVDLGSSGRRALASLPDTFDTITFVFGGSNSSSITKQELVHKIISYNLNVEDRREVEEQLSLLEELVPDWICSKMMSTGDLMYCISRASDPKSVRARLVEAL